MVDQQLSIFFGKRTVGTLEFDTSNNSFAIVYSSEWKSKGFALSLHLPLDQPHEPGAATRFLENLLPEGEGLVELARTVKVSKNNLHALIIAIGKDTTGAFTIATTKQKPTTSFREIPLKELKARIKARATKPITVWDGKPRLSLAGVQEKLPITLKDGVYGFGEGDIASTHILKFGNQRAPHIVLNEYFCMKLIAQTSLPVAKVELLDLTERVLQVERFDRKWYDSERVSRQHIIDGCQALDLVPLYKYEKFLGKGPQTDDILGPASLKNIYHFARICKLPANAQLITLQWIFVNLIIGNCDHHVKNISYYVNGTGIKVAPAYDLLNITMYPDFDQELAFGIGETFDLDQVDAYQLSTVAHELKLSPKFIGTHLTRIANQILKALPEVKIGKTSAAETKFLNKLKNDISTRAGYFLEVTKNL